MARSGLKKVVKTVKGKRGSVKRSYWVRAGDAAKSAGRAVRAGAQRHSGKLKVVAGIAALAGLAYGAHRAPAALHGLQAARTNFANNRGAGGGRIESALTAMRHGSSAASDHGGSLAGRNMAGLASYGARSVSNAAQMRVSGAQNRYGASRAGGGGVFASVGAAMGRGRASNAVNKGLPGMEPRTPGTVRTGPRKSGGRASRRMAAAGIS